MDPPGASWWPVIPPPTADQVRPLLARWARQQRFVPNNLFDGRVLEVADGSVVRLQVDRLVEERTEASRTVPGPLGPRPVYDDLEAVRLDRDGEPAWEERDWRGVKRGTVTTANCSACVGQGSVACSVCKGRGRIDCPKTVPCERCRRRGWVDVRPPGRPVPCPNCQGETVLRCRTCRGIGERRCTNTCTGGRVGCGTCQGLRVFTTYREGWIRRVKRQSVVQDGAGLAAGEATGAAPYQLVVVADRAPDLSALPERLRDKLAAELNQRPRGELRRAVRIWVLPVVVARYLDGATPRIAYLIGHERRVHAPGAKGLRFPFGAPR